jgi:hypothetical protein
MENPAALDRAAEPCSSRALCCHSPLPVGPAGRQSLCQLNVNQRAKSDATKTAAMPHGLARCG